MGQYRVMVRKTEGKRLLGIPRQKVEGNITTYFNEIQREDVDWMHMAQNVVGNFEHTNKCLGSINYGEFLD
jgi:hypothetical protein